MVKIYGVLGLGANSHYSIKQSHATFKITECKISSEAKRSKLILEKSIPYMRSGWIVNLFFNEKKSTGRPRCELKF